MKSLQWTKAKTLYFWTFAAQRRICWGQHSAVVRGKMGKHRACWLQRKKIGTCPSFSPNFDLSSNFDSGDSLGFLDISVRRENFGQSESSLVHDSEVLEASQLGSNTLWVQSAIRLLVNIRSSCISVYCRLLFLMFRKVYSLASHFTL